MEKRVTKAMLGLLAGAAATVPVSAEAAVGIATLPQSFALIAGQDAVRCKAGPVPGFGQLGAAAGGLATDKASAILGGKVSRLELIRRQQASAESSSPAAAPAPRLAASPSAATPRQPCFGLAAYRHEEASGATTQPLVLPRDTLANDDFLASKRLAVGRTGFDSEWNRVASQRLPRGAMKGLDVLRSGARGKATLAAVNAWANARIRYAEDRALYGRADYWAGARTTLRRGAGDCEDIAIVKLQLLAAAGIPRSDMYLTIARDLVRNADHALLIVKLDGRYWALDNATNELLDARSSHDYRPILSFGATGKWLHGYAQPL